MAELLFYDVAYELFIAHNTEGRAAFFKTRFSGKVVSKSDGF